MPYNPTSLRRSAYAAALPLLAALTAASVGGATTPHDWNIGVNVTPFLLQSAHGPQVHPNSDDRLRLVVSHDSTLGCLGLHFAAPQVVGSRIVIAGQESQSGVEPCTPQRSSQQLEMGPLAVGIYTFEVRNGEELILSQEIEVVDAFRVLFLNGVSVQVVLTDPRIGPARQPPAVQLTPQAGYFWFFDPDNVEVTVKVLDGRPVNGHFWIFVEGMTDIGMTVIASRQQGCFEPGSCPTVTYVNPPGQRLNVIDTSAF